MSPFDDVRKAADRIHAGAARVAGTTTAMGPLGSRGARSGVMGAAAATLLLFFAARFALELEGVPAALRIAIALMPLPAFVWLLLAFARLVKQGDELERRVQLEALAIAFPLTLVLVMTLGLLQIAVPLPPEDWSYRHIWPLLYVFYLLGLTRARKKYA